MRKLFYIFFIINIFILDGYAQEETPVEKGRSGNNIGVLPAISYNSDLGFQYGVLANFYNYGDGSTYPKYWHSLYAEVSHFTKGSGVYHLFYDSEFVIPNIRLTADLAYLTTQALDFYGYNGYDAVYNKAYTDDASSEYISRMYYKHERNMFQFKMDFQGSLIGNFNWAAGYSYLNTTIGRVPIDKLNKGLDDADLLPDTTVLYDKYIDWGIIGKDEADGGVQHNIKLGLVYDTRDNEACPMSGMWSEIVMLNSFGKEASFGKLSITHRQYFTLIPENLSLAYRVGYQGNVWGDVPFYLYPYMVYSYMASSSIDGLGGSKTVRGMIMNRLVAESFVYGNVEMRWKFAYFKFLKQDWYAAAAPFMDFGRTLKKVKLNLDKVADEELDNYFAQDEEAMHITYGGGLHFAMNQNFVISADVGMPVNKQDGGTGVYIAMNWLF